MFSKIFSAAYQEIPPYTIAVIQTKFNSAAIKEQNSYLLTADSVFIDNNPSLKCYSMLVNNNTLHPIPTLLHTITNNSDNRISIPEGITISTSESTNENEYDMNDIILNNRTYDTWSNTINSSQSISNSY